jgi:hypothetical protein
MESWRGGAGRDSAAGVGGGDASPGRAGRAARTGAGIFFATFASAARGGIFFATFASAARGGIFLATVASGALGAAGGAFANSTDITSRRSRGGCARNAPMIPSAAA